MANKYKINRSNYTLRSRHQMTSGGVVYERDFMTTTNLGGWDSGSIPYGENNFKMVYRRAENARRNLRRNSWLCPNPSCEDPFWKTGDVDRTGVTESENIKIKPNYHSLLDFAYYGSCQELVKSTIRKIVDTFPGEACVDTMQIYDEHYFIDNPFNIDFFDTKNSPCNGDDCMAYEGYEYEDKGIRNFVENYDKYVVTIDGVEHTIENVIVEVDENACEHWDIIAVATITLDNGTEVSVEKRIFDDKELLFTGVGNSDMHIHLKQEYVEEFFRNLDDFSRVLLDRYSTPIYTATLDWPHETDRGVMTYRRSFTWPMKGDWNLDVESPDYETYLSDILSIAEFYDEWYTDNLWRMLTHDSVKSMDLAFSNPMKDEDEEDYTFGATKLEGLLWAYGRQFDEIKRSIDNIKFNSNVTYNEENNMPDYFLSDSLELSGWDVYNVDNGLEPTSVDISWDSDGAKKTYTTREANFVFLRNLKLNAKNILQKKGTRDGIISLLGLFGLEIGEDYTITEEVVVVNDQIELLTGGTKDDFLLAELNELKSGYATSLDEIDYDPFDGLPFAYVEMSDGKLYIVPWFRNGDTYDGGMYFQMYGGWSKNEAAYGNELKYGETYKYISVVDRPADILNLPKNKIYEGSICYTESLDGIEEYVGGEDTSNYSQYFILKDPDNSLVIGEGGWEPVYNGSPSADTIDAVESIVDDFTANNPHIGYGKYDDGQEFIERIRKPFRYHAILQKKGEELFDDRAYDCNGNLDPRIKDYTVSLEGEEDNKKVWFFGDVLLPDGSIEESEIDYKIYDFETGIYGNDATEAAANSIINTKVVKLVFSTYFMNEFKDYFDSVILPYLKQIMPSGTLWSYEILSKEMFNVEVDRQADSPITIDVDAIAYRNETRNDDFITNYEDSHNIKTDTQE